MAAWLLSLVRHHLSAGSAALWVVRSFVHNSHQKSCDNRMKDPSLRIQIFLRVNLSRPFLGKGRLVLLRMLLKNFRVALRETLQVLCALDSWHTGSCAIRLAALMGVNGNSPWKGAQEMGAFEEGLFVSA